MQAWGEREVGEGGDVVVGEVDGILVLLVVTPDQPFHSLYSKGSRLRRHMGRAGRGTITLATPRFSIAGILWPAVLEI